MKLENVSYVKYINLDTFDYPEVEVHTWTNLFEEGGSVDV
jgi:hypothetical protein